MSENRQAISARYQFLGSTGKATVRLSTIERGVVYAGLFLAPYPNLRFADVFFTASDLLFCISFVLLLISACVPSRPLNEATPIWLVAFTLLIAGLMTGSLLHESPEKGLFVITQYLFAYLLLMVIMVREDPVETSRLAAIFLASIVLVDIHGIYTFYAVGYVPTEGKGVVTGALRLATVLRNPNLAAAMNALTTPILLYFWFSGRMKFYLALPVFGVCATAVVLTSSNSGLILMIICITIFVAFTITMRLLLRLVVGVCILVGALTAFAGTELLPKAFHTRVLSAFTSGDVSEAGTFVSRAELMKEALDIIHEEQILFVGIGADQFRDRSVQNAPVHNLYLLLWAEGGLLAVVGWIMFSAVGVLLCFAIRRAGGDKHALAAVAATVVVFLAIAMFNPHMYARYWTAPVFLSFGLGLMQLRGGLSAIPHLRA